ncbi:MAG TPA: TonB-dependent receptor [Flavipsychrobacter sp.]|nr:TonB-dependent receptor [Flavipsychrobacter sp.]
MRIISMLLFFFLTSVISFAGKITGKVSDEKTGEPLIGATVLIKGTANGTATDVDGNFILTADPRTHTLEVKYIGYQSKEIDGIVIKSDEVVTVNIVIAEATSTQLNEVVVRSSLKKENISALYVMQKNAVSVSSGISADIIQRSPDRNTGEVLKRVSGASIQNGKFVIIRGLSERYNAAMINGAQMQSTEPDKKAFSYDVIPSNLIDNIIISKTASADLPGDFAGGVVQVLTKDVPDNSFFNVGVGLGYNTQATLKNTYAADRSTGENLGLRNSKNELPNSFGSSVQYYRGLTTDQKFLVATELKNNYRQNEITALPNMSLQLSAGDARRFRNGSKLGTVLGLSYRNSYNESPNFYRSTWGANGSRENGVATEERWTKFTSALSGLANFSYVANKSKYSLRSIFNSIHDDVNYSRHGFSYGGTNNFATLYSTVPLDRQLVSTQLDGDHAVGSRNIKVNWNLNYALLFATQHDLRSVGFAQNGKQVGENKWVPDENAPVQVNERNSRRFFSDLTDHSFGGNASTIIPFILFGQKQSLKAGYLGLRKTREFNARIFQYRPGLNHVSKEGGLYYEIFDRSNINNTGFELEEISNPTDRYDASSMLHAGFLMFDNHISDAWRISWGVRYETYEQNLRAVNMSGTKINQTDVFADWLPSMNLSYSPSEKTKVRFSASRTVNRPEFREIAPFMFVDFENNWQITGNPNLKRSNITNLDARYEYYPGAGEAITAGVFYKHFQNPIENRMDDQSNLDLMIFGIRNAPSARAFGAELEVRKNLSFVSESLENFIVGANLTYVNSRVNVDSAGFGVTKARPLQGQSPYLINFSVLYNEPKTGLGISALYNRIGDRIYIVGSRDIPTTWERGRDVIDFQISKPLLKKRAEIKLTISDLLNQNYMFYWAYDNNNRYDVSADRVFQRYNLGTTFTLGFTYKFGK